MLTLLLIVSLSKFAEVPPLDAFGGDNDCGRYSFELAVRSLDTSGRLRPIEPESKFFGAETSLYDLMAEAEKRGIYASGVRWEREIPQFTFGKAAVILPVVNAGRHHFVTALASRGDLLLVADFPHSPIWTSTKAVKSEWLWDGTGLHLTTDPLYKPKSTLEIKLSAFWSWLLGGLTGCALTCVIARAFYRPSANQCYRHNAGFTLIELMAVLAIVGLLLAILGPAVQHAREQARRTQCRSNLRQFGIALTSYESTYSRLPPCHPGYVDLTVVPSRYYPRNLSVHVRLLPYLGESALFQSLNLDDSGDLSGVEPPQSALNPGIIGLPVAIFTCRSDTTGVTGTNYRVCMGTTPGFHQELTANPENSARLGSFSFFGRRIGEITDGLSQTSLMAERVQGDRRPNVYAPSRDTAIVSGLSSTLPNDVASGCRTVSASQPHYSFGGSAWIYSGYAHTWYNHVHTPNSITPDCAGAVQPSGLEAGAHTSRSMHAGGVQVLIADGAVRFISDSIDQSIWRAIATADGGESHSDF